MILNPLNNRKPVPFELYRQKKNKQPDHLFNLIAKSRKQKENTEVTDNLELDFKVKEAIRRHMIQKRVNNILTCPATVTKSNLVVSEPAKCIQKPWIPPMEKEMIEKKFSQEQLIVEAKKKQQKTHNRQKITKLLKVINLNKKMRYFGDFLSSQFDSQQRRPLSICHIPKTKQSKLSFLESKYKRIMAKQKPKLFILNSPLQQQKYFNNPLQSDEYFATIMKAHDKQLMRILIQVLSEEGHFTLSSFTKFYDIFVWQTATRLELTKFAARILMGDKEELPILKISHRIDEICGKIDLEELNQNTENFAEIMKKLLFGEEFVFALKNQYFLTRKALTQSLERNEECISIFINVFYM